MTVAQIITFIRRVLGDNTSRTAILSYLDARVKELYDGLNQSQMIYFDSTTGRHPYLTTTAGTYQYDYPSWAIDIIKVYDSDAADEEANIYPDYTVTADPNSRKITFAEDPGTTTTTYKILGTYGPTDMTGETDSLCVVPTNSRMPLLAVGVISLLQPNKQGYSDEKWEYLKAEFRAKIRSSATPLPWQRRMKREFNGRYGITTSDYRKRI